MSKETETTNTETAEKKEKVVIEIIRGRMPKPVAAAIKFKEDEEATDAALAAKYRTTNGKVSDIRNNRNFAYLAADTKFTPGDFESAKAYVEQLDGSDEIMKVINGFGVLSTDEIAAAAKAKAANKPAKKAATKKAPAKKAEPEVEETEEATTDDLDDLLDD